MAFRHFLILLLVAALWGFNFIAIRVGLDHLHPLILVALRFLATVFPAILFIKRPRIPLLWLAAYGLMTFAGQFGFLFSSIAFGLSPGLASLLLQMQAFFTIGFAVLFLSEQPKFFQIAGALVAMGGLGIVMQHTGGEANLPSILMILLAAASWGGGNIMIKRFGNVDMFGVIIWGNFFAFIPMAILAYLVEGETSLISVLLHLQLPTLLALAYIVIASTFVGYTLWCRMLARYPAAMVAPFTLLVPAFGIISTHFFLGEAYPLWKFGATSLIIAGLCLNQFGGKALHFVRRRRN